MTRKTYLLRRQQHARQSAPVPVPHPSWSRTERPSTGTVLGPDDFWSRLGL